MNLDQAVVYDIETFPNVFTLHAEMLHSDISSTWEISTFRDDRQYLIQWFNHLNLTQTPMIGFYSEHFDYIVIHFIMMNPTATVQQIYEFAMMVINEQNKFKHSVWQNKRFAPQIDLFKIHHFDNRAKTTSLKALEINMRSNDVVDVIGTEIALGSNLTRPQIGNVLIPYNKHDVKETKKFAWYSMPAIEFRIKMIGKIPGDVLNFNDTKIGAKILEQRLGDNVCYLPSSNGYGRGKPRQTVRHTISLNEIIFPYIYFENPEFKRVLDWMKTQTLTSDDILDPEATIKTKGVFSKVKANVGGMEFHFGTGGIHGSVAAQRVYATDNVLIEDIDVASLYPSIAIVNKLTPEHLGEAFSVEYEKLLIERRKHKKGTVENASLKLAANGTYGNSNNKFSVFYDPKFTMTITINGQLMLCMLAEWLLKVPTLQFIQINTDGITYKIHKEYTGLAKEIQERWEKYTLLNLESAHYSRMFIRDVNNYIAESVVKIGDNKPPSVKQKGAYWHPDPSDYAKSISTAGPPAWHKDFNPVVVTKAAVAAMMKGIDPEIFIRLQHDPFDFMCRVKVDRSSKLMFGQKQIQSTTRYYIANNGDHLKKISPPAKGAVVGTFKRKSRITDVFYKSVLAECAGTANPVWDERIHTKNKSTYQIREMAVNAGFKVAICNRASDFDFSNINYDWYVNEARKLIIN